RVNKSGKTGRLEMRLITAAAMSLALGVLPVVAEPMSRGPPVDQPFRVEQPSKALEALKHFDEALKNFDPDKMFRECLVTAELGNPLAQFIVGSLLTGGLVSVVSPDQQI